MKTSPKPTEVVDRAVESASERPAGKPTSGRRVRRALLGPGSPRESSKLSQRWRLIQAMIELSAKSGSQEVSIAELCAGAGVSQQTFYEQFADKEDVLVGAYRASAEGIFGQMRSAIADGEISEVPRRSLGAMLKAVASDPDAGRVLFIEAMGGGGRMLEERTRAFGRFERRAEELLALTPEDSSTLDVPVIAVVGALRHIVSRHLRNYAEDELPSRLDDGLAWLYSYARAPGAARWSTSPAALLERPTAAPSSPPEAARPERLPPGRHGLPAAMIARHQRTRLIFAMADLMMAKGYADTTVEDIAIQARVAKPVFYRYFQDKQHAFLEAQQYPTQFILDRCAQAYYSAREWPERMWRMLEILIDLIVSNPAISHLRLVECYAAGPVASRRAEEITRSFTIFLEEGYHYAGNVRSLPRLSLQAITGAIFEIVQRQIAEGDTGGLSARLPQLAYIAIAPFAGAEEAIRLVEGMKGREDAGGGS
jgi:AcrR family transcriptional regulator